MPKIQLKAAPVDGKANQALVAFVADLCRLPKSAVRIASGETSRVKRIVVEGIADHALQSLLGGARDVRA